MSESFMDFGELSHDENFKKTMIDFRKSVVCSSKMLETFFKKYNYDGLSPEDKIRYNLFLAFAIDSYFWMYLRIRGIDPNQHDIKQQINRVREYMKRSKEIYEKKTKMPKIEKGAVSRFIRKGLWAPQNVQAAFKSDSHEMFPESKTLLKRKRTDSEN